MALKNISSPAERSSDNNMLVHAETVNKQVAPSEACKGVLSVWPYPIARYLLRFSVDVLQRDSLVDSISEG